MGMTLGEMAREGEQRRKVMQVRGTLAEVFTEALQMALGKDSTEADRESIAVRVAMESNAQSNQFIQEVAEQYGNDYKVTNDPIEISPENKVVVDVIDGDSPDENQLLTVSKTLDEFDQLGTDRTESSLYSRPSEYMLVVATRHTEEASAANADALRRRELLDSVAGMVRRAGHRVESVQIEQRNVEE